MHELSLAESILDILRDGARTHGYHRVKTVWLAVGKLSHVEPEAMRFCFDVAARDSLAEGARLEIVEVAGEGSCAACGAHFAVESRLDPCPRCAAPGVRLTAGDELRVTELEVE